MMRRTHGTEAWTTWLGGCATGSYRVTVTS